MAAFSYIGKGRLRQILISSKSEFCQIRRVDFRTIERLTICKV